MSELDSSLKQLLPKKSGNLSVQKRFTNSGSAGEWSAMLADSRYVVRGRLMIEAITLFVIMTALLLAPLWVYYRMAVSRETRSHLNALLLHDIIRAVIKGIIRLFKGIASLVLALFTGIKNLLGP